LKNKFNPFPQAKSFIFFSVEYLYSVDILSSSLIALVVCALNIDWNFTV